MGASPDTVSLGPPRDRPCCGDPGSHGPAGRAGHGGRQQHALHGPGAERDDFVRLEPTAHLPGARAQRTPVAVRFEPVGDKATHVKLHHTGWGNSGEPDKTNVCFERACGNVLANVKRRLDTGPQDWSVWLEQLPKFHGTTERNPATMR